MVFGCHSNNGILFGGVTCNTGCYFVMDYGFVAFAHNVDSECLLKECVCVRVCERVWDM
jgi:hypothetical protein